MPSCRCRRRRCFRSGCAKTGCRRARCRGFLHTDLAQVGLLAVGAEILRTVVFGVPDAACPNGVAAVFGKHAVQFVLYGENAVERGGKFTQTAIGITADQVALRLGLRLGLRLRQIPAGAAGAGKAVVAGRVSASRCFAKAVSLSACTRFSLPPPA